MIVDLALRQLVPVDEHVQLPTVPQEPHRLFAFLVEHTGPHHLELPGPLVLLALRRPNCTQHSLHVERVALHPGVATGAEPLAAGGTVAFGVTASASCVSSPPSAPPKIRHTRCM